MTAPRVPVFDLPRFFRECAARGEDPAVVSAALAKAIKKASPAELAAIARIQPKKIGDDGQPWYPTGWCQQDNGYWNPWCSALHRFVCGYWGFGVVDFSDCPDPDPQ